MGYHWLMQVASDTNRMGLRERGVPLHILTFTPVKAFKHKTECVKGYNVLFRRNILTKLAVMSHSVEVMHCDTSTLLFGVSFIL